MEPYFRLRSARLQLVSWIAKLDTRARNWPPVARASYRALKWLLVALGAWVAGGLLIQRLNPQYWRDMLG
jgi:hypothetical protein